MSCVFGEVMDNVDAATGGFALYKCVSMLKGRAMNMLTCTSVSWGEGSLGPHGKPGHKHGATLTDHRAVAGEALVFRQSSLKSR